MIGFVELLFIIAFIGAAAALGVAYLRPRRRPLPPAMTPSLPPKPPPKPSVEAHEVVHLRGGDLVAQLSAHAAEAERRGLRPFVEFGAVWCPPSKLFGEALEHPRMIAVLAGIYLIRAESDDFPQAQAAGFDLRCVPIFFELDAEGRPTGRRIDGGAWGADTLDNMVRVMGGFFAG